MSTHLKSKGTLIIWSLFAPKKGPIWSIRTNWFIEQLIGPVGFWHAGCSLDGASTYTLYLAKNIITICVSTASCHILLSDDFGTKEIDSMWLSLSSYLSFPKAISSSWNWFAYKYMFCSNFCTIINYQNDMPSDRIENKIPCAMIYTYLNVIKSFAPSHKYQELKTAQR